MIEYVLELRTSARDLGVLEWAVCRGRWNVMMVSLEK